MDCISLILLITIRNSKSKNISDVSKKIKLFLGHYSFLSSNLMSGYNFQYEFLELMFY